MGIDYQAGGRKPGRGRTQPKSQNLYLNLLVKLYRFLARRTNSKFNEIVHKRLCFSRNNRPALSLSRLVSNIPVVEGKAQTSKTVVVVAKVTDDIRQFKLPAVTVCALGFTRTARARIVGAGGKCITFDQLAVSNPTGSNTVLMQARRTARKVFKYFGIPGAKDPKERSRPYVRSKGRKFERARGRRSGVKG